MQTFKQHISYWIAAAIAAAIGSAIIGAYMLGDTLKKLSIQGSTMRVSEVNTCSPTSAVTSEKQAPHFSGCNSIL